MVFAHLGHQPLSAAKGQRETLPDGRHVPLALDRRLRRALALLPVDPGAPAEDGQNWLDWTGAAIAAMRGEGHGYADRLEAEIREQAARLGLSGALKRVMAATLMA